MTIKKEEVEEEEEGPALPVNVDTYYTRYSTNHIRFFPPATCGCREETGVLEGMSLGWSRSKKSYQSLGSAGYIVYVTKQE